MGLEEYVRAKWSLVHLCDGSYRGYPRGTVLLQDVNNHWFDFDAWEAAYEFTLAREEEIRQVEEETFALYKLCPCRRGSMDCVCEQLDRTKKRLEAILADLRKGMK